MSDHMKRRQFHLSVKEEKIVYEIAKKNHISEAEVVRMAIRELAKNNSDRMNSLLKMAEIARQESEGHDVPNDLSEQHDRYMLEAYEDET